MEVQVIIPSHKRAGRVTTHKHVAHTRLCIPESQYAEYAKHHPKESLIVHPDSIIGMCAKRQWICDLGDVFMLDDDAQGMYRIYKEEGGKGRGQLVSAERAYEIIQLAADTARQMQAHLFGFNSHAHPMTFNQFRPFKFGGYTPSGAVGILAGSKIWFPVGCTLPIEDYWICLMNAYAHRYAWYDCRFAFGFNDTYRNPGGFSEFRIGDTEKPATAMLVRTFGAAVQKKTVHGKATKRSWNRWARRIVLPFKV